MPWQPRDSRKHTKAAASPAQQKRWAATANAVLRAKKDDAAAIRIANAAVKRKKG